jgi:hypothetical protein
MPRTRHFESHQIPQADNLDDVRRVVAGVADGATPAQISERTEISARHVSYALQAAKTLGWLAPGDKPEVTDLGQKLLATAAESLEERDCFRRAITESDVLKSIAPELLAPATPSRDDLTARIRRAVPDLSEETAKRRAQTLLSWRTRASDAQASLFADAPADKAGA